MPKAQDLPNEVSIQIFQVAPRTTVYQCISVCKAWKTAALQVYYQELYLTSRFVVNHLKPILASNKIPPPQLPSHLHLVKCLNVQPSSWNVSPLTQYEFSSLLSCMPNLKIIDFNNTGLSYLNHLNNILEQQNSSNDTLGQENNSSGSTLDQQNRSSNTLEQHNSSNNILEQQNSSNNTSENASALSFDRVKEIRYGPLHMFYALQMKVLFGVCYALRENLTYLYLRLSQKISLPIEDRIVNYVQLLLQFKKLTHLTIDNGSFSRGDADDSNLSVVSIFKACPNVVKFNLSSTFQLLHNEDGSAARFNDFKATTSTTRATTIVDTDGTPVLVSPTSYHSSLISNNNSKIQLNPIVPT